MSSAVEPRDASLDELAHIANEAHRLVGEHLGTLLQHAIAAGHALNAAYEKVPRGEWRAWLAENFAGSYKSSGRYRRFALNEATLRELNPTGIRDAERCLALLNSTSEHSEHMAAAQERRRQARVLHDRGESLHAIADLFCVSHTAVRYWLMPEKERRAIWRKSKTKRNDAMKALERQRRDRAMKHAAGDIARAYSQMRVLAQTLEAAAAQEKDREARANLRVALSQLYKVEDQIVRASRLSVAVEGEVAA